MLIVVRALIAQPFASNKGAKFLLRSFNQARIIEGPEIHKIIPSIAKGICHHLRPKNPVKNEASTEPIAPDAKLHAAKIPTNLPISNGVGGVACFAAAAVLSALLAIPSSALRLADSILAIPADSTSFSFEEANFSI